MSINVLVADDSAYLRKNIADILTGHKLIKILEFAKNGEEAVDLVKKYHPDVLVLDLVMPKMNGLEAFRLIMEDCPTPTVILSAISPKNLDSSIQALLMGAFDYIIKPGGIGAKNLPMFREELLAKVLLASQSQIKKLFRKEGEPYKKGMTLRQEIIDEIFNFGQYLNRLQPVQETEEDQGTQIIDIGKAKVLSRKKIKNLVIKEAVEKESNKKKAVKPKKLATIKQQTQNDSPAKLIKKKPKFIPNLAPVKGLVIGSNVVVIGASVGGPRTITTILKDLPGNLHVPILIVQHLSSHFTQAFVDNLDIECNLRIKIAIDGEILQPGVCYIAPGDKHMEIGVKNKRPFIKIYKGAPVNFCLPSIDVLFFSAARVYKERAMGIILTGMGSDGVEGLGAIKNSGGNTIAESEETSILYAMPKFAAEKGFANHVLRNDDIGQQIIRFASLPK
ncbi:MAG: chemotaxis-specific protein-glutamate methyltransferase CheB [Promethearchaeota archaeon]|jgi:two-component system chemotaxis response regulator CheB